ncbi:recombination mediator RecR [Patescibacteria group bacterium]
MYPKSFKNLIENFSSLPSVGPKMAERLVLHLFKQDKEKLEDFSNNLLKIKDLTHCKKCFNISEGDMCEICTNPQRNQDALCVVEDPLDIISIERTGIYKGIYHVLGGTMETSSSKKEPDLKIGELLKRVQDEGVKEVIIATNPTTEGDLTALYLKRKLQDFEVKVTRLARGLSTGGDIEYADEVTISGALSNRKEL